MKGRIVVGQRAGVLQVRKEALLNWNLEAGKAEVFVVTGDKAQKRAVSHRHERTACRSRCCRASSPATRWSRAAAFALQGR